jgi:hypothetical protein
LRAAGVHKEDRKALLGHTTGTSPRTTASLTCFGCKNLWIGFADSERATVLRIKRPESGQNAGTVRGKTRDLANAAQVLDNAALQSVGQ